jgi:hypothetical protein
MLALYLALSLAAIAPIGCAGQNPFTSRQTTVGSLKASVSQLEFENEKLRREVGELKADNSRLDVQLAQEREANGEITARLDDAKDLLRRQGGNAQAMGASSSNFEDDVPPPVAAPRPRRIKNNRPAPPASIRNPDSDPSGDNLGSLSPGGLTPRDIGPDGDDDDRWLPVARGLPSQVPVRK